MSFHFNGSRHFYYHGSDDDDNDYDIDHHHHHYHWHLLLLPNIPEAGHSVFKIYGELSEFGRRCQVPSDHRSSAEQEFDIFRFNRVVVETQLVPSAQQRPSSDHHHHAWWREYVKEFIHFVRNSRRTRHYNWVAWERRETPLQYPSSVCERSGNAIVRDIN